MSSAPPNNVTEVDSLDEDAMLKGRKMAAPDALPLSSSVVASLRNLPEGRPVRAGAQANALLKQHPEYGGGLAGRVTLFTAASPAARSARFWMRMASAPAPACTSARPSRRRPRRPRPLDSARARRRVP